VSNIGLIAADQALLTHENMNSEVKGDGDPGDGGSAVELSVAEDGRGSVVENMEKLKGLLLKDKEDSVGKLPVPCDGLSATASSVERDRKNSLEVVVDHIQRLQSGGPAHVVADAEVKAVFIYGWDDLEHGVRAGQGWK
jgi:hypothetical protein